MRTKNKFYLSMALLILHGTTVAQKDERFLTVKNNSHITVELKIETLPLFGSIKGAVKRCFSSHIKPGQEKEIRVEFEYRAKTSPKSIHTERYNVKLNNSSYPSEKFGTLALDVDAKDRKVSEENTTVEIKENFDMTSNTKYFTFSDKRWIANTDISSLQSGTIFNGISRFEFFLNKTYS